MNAARQESKTVTIRAAVLRGKGGPLGFETLEIDGPRDDEALIRIAASGVCHTDISYIREWYDSDEGALILGHEGSGVVERVGGQVKGLRRGDHVVLSYQSCGTCSACRKGRPADCARLYDLNFGFRRADGTSAYERSGVKGHFFGQSSFATYSIATARNLVKVPKALPLETLAPLGCGLQTGAGTVLNSLAVGAGESVAVFGTGSVGLAAVMAARLVKAAPIIAIDIVPHRLKLALEMGATHAINSRREDVGARVKQITGGGVDYSVEGTGDENMLGLSMELLNPGGTAGLLTGAAGPGRLPGGRKALSIIQGDAVPQVFIPKLIALYRKGLFPFDRLIRFYDLKQINRAISDSVRGAAIKPVIRMPDVSDHQ